MLHLLELRRDHLRRFSSKRLQRFPELVEVFAGIQLGKRFGEVLEVGERLLERLKVEGWKFERHGGSIRKKSVIARGKGTWCTGVRRENEEEARKGRKGNEEARKRRVIKRRQTLNNGVN